MNVVDEFNAVVYLFCFEWFRDGRKVDWYNLDVTFVFKVEGFLYKTFLSF